jgi:hypothetical protein
MEGRPGLCVRAGLDTCGEGRLGLLVSGAVDAVQGGTDDSVSLALLLQLAVPTVDLDVVKIFGHYFGESFVGLDEQADRRANVPEIIGRRRTVCAAEHASCVFIQAAVERAVKTAEHGARSGERAATKKLKS